MCKYRLSSYGLASSACATASSACATSPEPSIFIATRALRTRGICARFTADAHYVGAVKCFHRRQTPTPAFAIPLTSALRRRAFSLGRSTLHATAARRSTLLATAARRSTLLATTTHIELAIEVAVVFVTTWIVDSGLASHAI